MALPMVTRHRYHRLIETHPRSSARGIVSWNRRVAPAAMARVARHADGFLCAAPLQWARPLIDQVHEQWNQAGRRGRPWVVGQVNVAVGDAHTLDNAGAAIADYYAFTGRPGWGSPISDPTAIAEAIAGYRELGVDELILYCYSDNADQIEELADLAL